VLEPTSAGASSSNLAYSRCPEGVGCPLRADSGTTCTGAGRSSLEVSPPSAATSLGVAPPATGAVQSWWAAKKAKRETERLLTQAVASTSDGRASWPVDDCDVDGTGAAGELNTIGFTGWTFRHGTGTQNLPAPSGN